MCQNLMNCITKNTRRVRSFKHQIKENFTLFKKSFPGLLERGRIGTHRQI